MKEMLDGISNIIAFISTNNHTLLGFVIVAVIVSIACSNESDISV